MAYGKIWEKQFVILSFFTCIILIDCLSLLQLSGTQKAKDEESKIISEQLMSDHEGYDEFLTDFEFLGDDASVAELQKKLIIKGQLVSSSEAAWDAMSPKLRCGGDLMKLQLSGPEVAQIELCRENGAPVSLAELPPHCGHTFPTYGGLVYATPYDGCGVMQQGGSYVVQIQWQGNSAVISCPVISTTTNETFFGPHDPAYLQILLSHSPPDTLSSAADPIPEPSTSETGEQPKPTAQEMVKPHGYPQAFPQRFWPYYFPHYHYPGKVYPTAKPTESTAQAPTPKPHLPGYPQMFWPYHYPHYHYGKPKPTEKPVPTSIPTTTAIAQAPTQKPPLPGYPQMFWPYYYPHYHYGKPKPTEKPVPTSIPTATAIAQAPTQKPPLPGYPQMFWPYYYPHYHYGKPKPTEKPVPTSIPTATAIAQAPTQKPPLPGYPQMFWPYYYPHYHYGKPKPTEKPVPTSIPTATAIAQAPTQKPPLPGYPQMFWPYYYPHYHYGKPKPTEKPVPTSIPTATAIAQAPTQKPPLPGYPQMFWPYYYPHYHHGKPQSFYPQYPVQPPKTTTTPPITTTPQPCTTTAAAECKPSANQPPNEPPHVYIPPSSKLYEKDPFALQFVDLSEFADSFP